MSILACHVIWCSHCFDYSSCLHLIPQKVMVCVLSFVGSSLYFRISQICLICSTWTFWLKQTNCHSICKGNNLICFFSDVFSTLEAICRNLGWPFPVSALGCDGLLVPKSDGSRCLYTYFRKVKLVLGLFISSEGVCRLHWCC